MEYWYENKIGEQFHVIITNEDLIDDFLDQMNSQLLKGGNYITKEQFNTDIELMDIDIMTNEEPKIKIGVLRTRKIDLDGRDSI